MSNYKISAAKANRVLSNVGLVVTGAALLLAFAAQIAAAGNVGDCAWVEQQGVECPWEE